MTRIAKDKSFDDIKVGDLTSFKRVIKENDLIKFANISGDHNPLHLDNKYAIKTEFKGRVVHGMFLAALVSRLVGMELPGKRALLVKECLEFKKPARVGDEISVKGTVIHKSIAARLAELSIEISVGKEVLALGSIHVKVL